MVRSGSPSPVPGTAGRWTGVVSRGGSMLNLGGRMFLVPQAGRRVQTKAWRSDLAAYRKRERGDCGQRDGDPDGDRLSAGHS